MFLNREIKNPKEDFKGLKIRSGAIYNPLIKALGASAVNVNAEEVYGAIQTGIVDGCAWVPVNFVSNKTYEVTKYWINHGFYRVTTCSVLNLKKWNSLPKDLQDLLATVTKEVEAEQYVTQRDQEAGHLKKIAEAGMKPITFSAEDANWYVRLAYDSKWAEAKDKLTPQDYDASRKLLMK
jgi:TRAP-type C4-dicarboxylate transport system substrate-binding protein